MTAFTCTRCLRLVDGDDPSVSTVDNSTVICSSCRIGEETWEYVYPDVALPPVNQPLRVETTYVTTASCPRCQRRFGAAPVASMVDGTTLICTSCALGESLYEFAYPGVELPPVNQSLLPIDGS